jgi:hypothetical protein
MPSAVSSEKLGSRIYIHTYDHDPGATTAILAGPDGGTTIRQVDMRDYATFGVLAAPAVIAAGGILKLEIVASATTAFSSVVSVKDSGTVAGDALEDNVFLECTDSEVVQLGSSLRYCAARVTMATATDEAKLTYIGDPKRKYTGLTATAIT